MHKLKTLLLFGKFYLRFVRETGIRRIIKLQILGAITCILNIAGISIIFPFFGVFISGKSLFIKEHINPHFPHGIPSWLFDHFPEALGLSLVTILIIKALFTMLFMGTASNLLEEYTAKFRNKINTHYIETLGEKLRPEKKSRIIYLNSQLVQFSSFSIALIDLNFKFYIAVTLVGFLLFLSAKLTLLACAMIGVTVLFAAPLYKWTRRVAEHYFSALENLQGQLTEFLDGAEVIRALNIADSRINLFKKTNANLIAQGYALSLSRYATYSLPEIVLMTASVCGVLIFKPDPTQMAFFGTYFYSMLKLVGAISDLNVRLNSALELQKVPVDIYNYLSNLHEQRRIPAAQSLPHIDKLRFEDIHIADGAKVILDKVTIDIPIGKKIQILGPNGSGKTSLIKCLMQNIPYEGVVLINDKNIREYSREDLANRVAYHGQNQFLFNDTIMGNLLVGNSSATPEKAKALCEKLGLDHFLSRLSDGYETWIREGSTNLSGGERQGLCLARTLLRPADLYIIDEYANHLDASILARVNDYLKNMRASLILITHDPVDFADQTLKFDKGKLHL